MGSRTDKDKYCRFCGKLLDDNYFFCNDFCAEAFEEEYLDIESRTEDAYKKFYRPV